jgi:uncharacterized protein YjbI with pentapeptide repeats
MARLRYDLLPPRIDDVLEPVDVGGLGDGDGVTQSLITGEATGHEAADLDIAESRLVGCVLTAAVLERIRLTDVVVEGCELSGATLDEAALTRVELRDCRLSGLDLTDAKLRDVRFSNCRLDDGTFRMISTELVEFEEVNLERADFTAAKLGGARFFGCDLTGAEFSHADLRKARLHGSTILDLKGAAYLKGVVIDSVQIIPLAPQILKALSISVDDERDGSTGRPPP